MLSWQKLLEQLALNGTNINSTMAAPGHSDPGKVQGMFNGAESAQLSNDGTFTLLEADDEVQARKSLAAYLAADTKTLSLPGRQLGFLKLLMRCVSLSGPFKHNYCR